MVVSVCAATGGGATGRGGAAAGGAAVAAGGAGFAAGGVTGGAGGRITEGAGRVVCGVMNLGAGVGGAAGFAAAGAGVAVGAGAGGAAVFVSTGGRGAAGRGGAGAVAACCFCVISFRTSPGLEMWERSILVLISSASRIERADRAGTASAVARKCARTLSASKSSSELEWVFFSVSPTTVRTSRIDLLLTYCSLA